MRPLFRDRRRMHKLGIDVAVDGRERMNQLPWIIICDNWSRFSFPIRSGEFIVRWNFFSLRRKRRWLLGQMKLCRNQTLGACI